MTAASPPRKCSAQGPGIVIFGSALVRDRRNAKSAAWIGPFQAMRLLIDGRRLRAATVRAILSRALRTRCRRAGRRNSCDRSCGGIRRRSQAAGRRAPASAIASSIARSSAAVSVAWSISPRAKRWRASSSAAGRSRLPTCSARKGGTGIKIARASALFPVRIAQAPLEDLAQLLARQRVGEFDHARHLVVGDALAQEALHRLALDRCAVVRLHVRGERLAELGVGNAEHRAVGDLRHGDEHRLDLGRIDVDAAGDHHVGLAVADVEIAVAIEVADVADRHEPVAVDRFAVLRPVDVGEVRVGGLAAIDQPRLERRQQVAGIVHDAHVGAGAAAARPSPDGCAIPPTRAA